MKRNGSEMLIRSLILIEKSVYISQAFLNHFPTCFHDISETTGDQIIFVFRMHLGHIDSSHKLILEAFPLVGPFRPADCHIIVWDQYRKAGDTDIYAINCGMLAGGFNPKTSS